MSPEIFEGVRKVRRRRMGSDSVAKTLAEWKKANNQVDSASAIDGVKQNQRVPSKGSKKGCMRGKGGPENSVCSYRGVRQRTWGRWVAEIREPINRSHKPNKGNRLWLGTFNSAVEAALAYDEAARTMYGPYARLNFPPAYGMESQEVLNASSSSITATQTWTPDPTVTPDTAATSYFPEVCEMRTADIVREIEDVNCTPIIHRDSINDDQDEEIVNREEMKELMDHTNFSNYNGFKDEHDDFQNLLMENIFEVAPLAEIKTDYSILRQEGFHGQLDSPALRQEQNHGFGQLENFELREEGNCDSGQLENSMLIQEWNYYSCQLGNSALRQEGMCNSSQFVLSKNGHLEGGMPSDLSYQLRNPDDKLFSSSGHIEEGVDPNLSSSRPDLGLADQGVLDLWFPELGFY